jgi:hypothetical protein
MADLDGSIHIGTKIDDSGLKAALASVESSLKDASKYFDTLGVAGKDAFKALSSQLGSVDAAASITGDKIGALAKKKEILNAEIQKLIASGLKPEDLQIRSLQNVYDNLTQAQNANASAGRKAGKTLAESFASIRDVMQGPIAAFNMVKGAIQGVSRAIDSMESEAADSAKSISLLDSTIKATGAGTWTSSKAIEGMIDNLKELTGVDDDVIRSMETVLLGFKNIKGDNFKEASLQIMNMATIMHMDLTSAAQAVGKALDDPISGIDSLSRQGFKFSAQQKVMLKDMVNTGHIADAQKVILDELATTYGGAAEAAGKTGFAVKEKLNLAIQDMNKEMGRSLTSSLAPFRQAFLDMAKAIGASMKAQNDFVDNMKKISNGTATTQEAVDGLTEKYNRLKNEQARYAASGDAAADVVQIELDATLELLNAKKSAQNYEAKYAAAKKANDEAAAKQAESDKKNAEAQAVITAARLDAVTKYQDAIRKINLQEKDGSISSQEASAKKLDALKTEISSLEDVASQYKLTSGATINLIDSETQKRNDLAVSIGMENQAILDSNAAKMQEINASALSIKQHNDEDRAREASNKAMLDSFTSHLKQSMKTSADTINAMYDMIAEDLGSALNAIGESLVTGESDWSNWGISALKALASVLNSIGYQLVAYAALHLVMLDFVGAAVAAAAATAAFVASGVISAYAGQLDTAAASEEEAATEAAKYTTELESANAELKKNKGLFTSASKAADAYSSVLTGVVKTVSSFYDGLKDVGSDLASTIIDSLTSGFDNDDFLYALEEYITKAVVQAAVFTDSFTSQIASIGAALATAIATGDTSAIAALRDQLAALYSSAAATAQAATEAVSGVFGSYAVGTMGLPSDGLIYAHQGEAVIPSGLMSEAASRGLTIAPTSSLLAGAGNVTVNLNAALSVDGRSMAGVVFKYQDDIVGAAYGS